MESVNDIGSAGMMLLGILIFACGVVAGWLAHRLLESRRATALATLEQARDAGAQEGADYLGTNFGKLCESVLPIWSLQVEAGRTQTADAVTTLAVRFSGLVEKLEAAVSASQSAAGDVDSNQGQDGLVALLTSSQQDLGSIIDSLRESTVSKHKLLREIDQLASFMDELKQMATEVGQHCHADQPASR